MVRTGWLWALIRAAERGAEDLYCIDRDCHEPAVDCSFCDTRIRLKRAATMARKQLPKVETALAAAGREGVGDD